MAISLLRSFPLLDQIGSVETHETTVETDERVAGNSVRLLADIKLTIFVDREYGETLYVGDERPSMTSRTFFADAARSQDVL